MIIKEIDKNKTIFMKNYCNGFELGVLVDYKFIPLFAVKKELKPLPRFEV